MKQDYLKHLFTALLLLCTTVVTAHDFEVGGIYYNILSEEDRTVAVTFKGTTYYEYSNEYSGAVIIPETVAYNGTTYSVTSIGRYAFSGCSSLTSVEIPNSVTSIGSSAFYGCTGLTSVHISDLAAWCGISFGNYDANPLYYAKNLYLNGKKVTNLVIPNSVTSIGDYAFNYCTGLESVVIPNSVTSIGSYAFEDCSGLTSIVIPNSVTSIGSYAFEDCSGLTSIEIRSSVTTNIGSNAFGGCRSLALVVVRKTDLGEFPFIGCDNLKYVVLISSEEEMTAEIIWDNDYGYGQERTLIGNEVIPENITINGKSYIVTSIGNGAFEDCSGLTSVVIPNSVTSIGGWAFRNCTGLTSIEIPSSVTSIGPSAFSGTAWYDAWYDNQQNGVAYLGKILYEYIGVMPENTSIKILEGTTGIAGGAFYGCSGLASIEIPNSVTSIGGSAFRDCTGLTSIEIPNSVTSIGAQAFFGCSGLTSVVIGDGVTSIGDYAFYNCSGLTSIEIPSSVTSIGGWAFQNCTGLTSITSLIPADALFALLKVFYNVNTSACTLYVPAGAKEAYASTAVWGSFANIVELEPTETATEVTIVINQYGCATYCSPYALDFSNVEGIKAYSAIGYKPSTQVVTLARVMTTGAGQGVFIKGEPGEYTVPVIDNFDEYTLNMLVGTLKQTTVNSTDGAMSNYKFTVAELDEAPMFYPFEDNTTFSAGKAYLQIPTAWLPATAQKSVSIRFDEGETTGIDELKGENGKLKGENGEVKTIYDLSGRVVENPTSGIYIINGKKTLVK